MNDTIAQKFSSNAVCIVTSFSDNYSLGGAALLNSIIKNSSKDTNYDIVIMEDQVSDHNKERLVSLSQGYNNISVRFFDVQRLPGIKEAFVRGYFSPVVYARLYIPKIFNSYNKVIYIDSDTIVRTDIAKLLSVDLEDNLIAAVKDIVMEGYVKFGVKSTLDSGDMEATKYLQEKLGISDPKKYFQAGILIFNIPKILSTKKDEELVREIGSTQFWFLDQDILNKIFYGNTKYLSLEWNVYHGNGNTNGFYPHLDPATYKEYLNARENAKMIHFAGDQKPWINKNVDFYKEFQSNVLGTTWESDLEKSLANVSFKKKLKAQITPLVGSLFPLGSARRMWLRNTYYKITSK